MGLPSAILIPHQSRKLSTLNRATGSSADSPTPGKHVRGSSTPASLCTGEDLGKWSLTFTPAKLN